MAAQLTVARCSSRAIGSHTVAPRRLSAAAPRKLVLARIAHVEAKNSVKPEKVEKKKHDSDEEEEFESAEDDGLSPQQVESFLSVLCEETDIAEVELKMGGFKMRVRRSMSGSAAAPAAVVAAVPVAAAPEAPVAAPTYSSDAPVATSSMESEEDESLLEVTANKVGMLRRARFTKGKQVGKGPMVQPGDQVKKGQTLAFIEQLGTHWPVEAPQAGEVVEFLVDEGAPVEYQQPVLVIAPYFGGHIIGDSKHA